jgi:hypothetical protein
MSRNLAIVCNQITSGNDFNAAKVLIRLAKAYRISNR